MPPLLSLFFPLVMVDNVADGARVLVLARADGNFFSMRFETVVYTPPHRPEDFFPAFFTQHVAEVVFPQTVRSPPHQAERFLGDLFLLMCILFLDFFLPSPLRVSALPDLDVLSSVPFGRVQKTNSDGWLSPRRAYPLFYSLDGHIGWANRPSHALYADCTAFTARIPGVPPDLFFLPPLFPKIFLS